MFSLPYLNATLAACAAGSLWLALCVSVGWSVCGWAGVLVGPIAAVAVYGVGDEIGSVQSGILAAALAPLLLGGAALVEQAWDRSATLEAATQEDSYLTALAEQIVWQRIAAKTEEDAQPSDALAEDQIPQTVPDFAVIEGIPPDLLSEARQQWAAMTDKQRDEFQASRERWMTTTLGPELEQMDRSPSWLTWLAVDALASSLAMAVLIGPLFVTEYLATNR